MGKYTLDLLSYKVSVTSAGCKKSYAK